MRTTKFKTVLFIIVLTLITSNIIAQELTQTIRGTVVDKNSKISLPGANVLVIGTEPMKAESTDFDGYFKITEVPLGRYNIQVSFLGYKTITIPNVLLSSGKEMVLDINLTESTQKLEEIKISASNIKNETINSMTTVSARTFSVEDTRKYAGGLDDPARMASAFAGVTVGNIQDNAIIIRGNSPKNVLWRLEGVEIPNPNHFAGGNVAGGGFVTIFSSQMLANSDFFTGAFPAEYGNATAGVFDMKFRTGNNEKREYAFQIGVLGIDFSAEGPFVKGGKASYLFNYRYSTMALIKPLIPSEQVPEYQDLSFKINFPTKNAGTFSIWGIGAKDLNTEPEETDSTKWETDWDRIKYKWNLDIGAIGLNHKKILNNSAYINTSLVASGEHNRMDSRYLNDEMLLQTENDFTKNSAKVTFSSFINKKFSAKHTNRTGFNFNNLINSMDLKYAPENILPLVSLVDEKGFAQLIQAYTQSKFSLSEKFTLNLGMHTQYFSLSDKYSFEPRAGFRWNFHPKHAFSFGYGNHSRIEPLQIYFYKEEAAGNEQPNLNLDFSKSHHIVIAYDWYIGQKLRLKVEPYFQYLYDVPVVVDSTYSLINFEQDWTFNNALINEGTGKNYGVDLTLERFLHNNFYFLITASVFKSTYVGGDGVEHSSRFDKGYAFNALAGKEFGMGRNKKKNILGVNTRISVTGGQKDAPVDYNQSILDRNIVRDWTKPYTVQNEPDIFVDLTLTFRRNKEKFSSVWAVQVKNILGMPSNYEQTYNYRTNNIEEESFVIVIPSISYKIEF